MMLFQAEFQTNNWLRKSLSTNCKVHARQGFIYGIPELEYMYM